MASLSSAPAPKLALAGLEDLLAVPEEDRRHEIIDGELVRKAMPSAKHGRAQAKLTGKLDPYHRGFREDRPGGWWFLTEVEVLFAPHQIYRPDVAGWRRERLPDVPDEMPLRVYPDWVCEILSPSNAQNDLIQKKGTYQSCQVPHYWLIDPAAETLSVYRWTPEGYLWVLSAGRGERVRAEPFTALEIPVGTFFGEDEPDE